MSHHLRGLYQLVATGQKEQNNEEYTKTSLEAFHRIDE